MYMRNKIAILIILLFICGCESNLIRSVWGPDDEDVYSLIHEAERLLEQKAYSEAYQKFNRALAFDPTLSRARYGLVKASIGSQIDMTSLVELGEKFAGIDESQPDGDPPDNEPLLKPADFKFDTTQSGRIDFYNFTRDNFIDLHQIIWGISDNEIAPTNVSVNLDCAVMGMVCGLLVVWKDHPQFNAFWDDSIKYYALNLSSEIIEPTSSVLAESEEYLEWAYSASDRAYTYSQAHSKTYLYQLREIIWSILNSVRFYRSL